MKILISCLTVLLLCSGAMADVDLINPGPIDVPEISVITLDGDLSDWADSSDVLTMGDWLGVPNAYYGLTQYAWNDSGNVMYVGLSTDVPVTATVDLQAAFGRDGNDASQDAEFGGSVGQYNFYPDPGADDPLIGFGGAITTGVSVGYATVAGVITMEAAIPVYDDHTNAGSRVDLEAGELLYNFADWCEEDGWSPADHQNFDGGYMTTHDRALNTFATQLNLMSGGIQVPGDANGDGKVTIADFLALQNHFNQAGTWADGDFNDDGQVTIADFLILQNNWGFGTASAASVPTIPEPVSFLLLSLGSLALIRRRK